MTKYYTRACNFYYGINAKLLIKKKLALPLCGDKNIAFDKVINFIREKSTTLRQSLSCPDVDSCLERKREIRNWKHVGNRKRKKEVESLILTPKSPHACDNV